MAGYTTETGVEQLKKGCRNMYILQFIDPPKKLQIIRKVAKVRGQVHNGRLPSHMIAADNRGQPAPSFISFFEAFPICGHPRTTKRLRNIPSRGQPRTNGNYSPQSRGQPRTTADKPRTKHLYRKLTLKWTIHMLQPCDFTQIGRSHEPFMFPVKICKVCRLQRQTAQVFHSRQKILLVDTQSAPVPVAFPGPFLMTQDPFRDFGCNESHPWTEPCMHQKMIAFTLSNRISSCSW